MLKSCATFTVNIKFEFFGIYIKTKFLCKLKAYSKQQEYNMIVKYDSPGKYKCLIKLWLQK